MIPLWNQQAMLGAEASQVVARRLWLIALGDPRGGRKPAHGHRKDRGARAGVVGHGARAGRRPDARHLAPAPHIHARRAVQTYRRKVRANLRRLAG
jgi:hypothetical protein